MNENIFGITYNNSLYNVDGLIKEINKNKDDNYI